MVTCLKAKFGEHFNLFQDHYFDMTFKIEANKMLEGGFLLAHSVLKIHSNIGFLTESNMEICLSQDFKRALARPMVKPNNYIEFFLSILGADELSEYFIIQK